MDTLISANELAANLDNPDWVVADCRFSLADPDAGRKAHQDSHIPGSFYISLDEHLSAPHIAGVTGRHPLPDKDDWAKTVAALGIRHGSQVVLYDDAGGAMAARMWWMLRWLGHEDVAVLNGGWQAWQQSGNAQSSAARDFQAGSAAYEALPALVQVIEAPDIDGDSQQLVDARDLPRYRGDTEPLDPVAGHIPGAVCSPFADNLGDDKHFLAPEQLREKFAAVIQPGKPVVCYCGSGVTAAHNILAMKIAGLEEPKLYPGSWSEWITDSGRPVATGDD